MGKRTPLHRLLLLVALLLVLTLGPHVIEQARAQGPECPPGFKWARMSGVGCMQANCPSIANAKYTYTGHCTCVEGYKDCSKPVDYTTFDKSKCGPNCPVSELVACVKPDAPCPGEQPAPGPGQEKGAEPAGPATEEKQPPSPGEQPAPGPGEEKAVEPSGPATEEKQPPSPGEQPAPGPGEKKGAEPGAPATEGQKPTSPPTVSDLLRDLEEFLAGQGVKGPTPGQAAAGAAAVSALLGTWVLINLLSGISEEDLRKAVQQWQERGGIAPPPAPPGPPDIGTIYNADPNKFRQCQDMVYGRLWNKPPPDNKGQDKANIYTKMEEEGYWQVHQGGAYDPEGAASKLASLRDGDIIMFGVDGLPDERNAAHYAIVENGRIYQILNLPKGGEPDIVDIKDASSFLGPRTARSLSDGKVYNLTAYNYFRIFRK
jgi:hypothetical protein